MDYLARYTDDDIIRLIEMCASLIPAGTLPASYEQAVYDALNLFRERKLPRSNVHLVSADQAVGLIRQLVIEYGSERRVRLRNLHAAEALVRQATDGLRCDSLRKTALGTIERLERLVLASDEDPTLRTRAS